MREERIARIARANQIAVGVVQLDDEVEVRVTEACGVAVRVESREIGAGANDVDDVRGIGRDEREEIDVAGAFENTVRHLITGAQVRAAEGLSAGNIIFVVVVFVSESSGNNGEVVLHVRRAAIFAFAPLSERGAVRRAHNGTPNARSAVIFGGIASVVAQAHGVSDFVRNRIRNRLRGVQRFREDVAVLFVGAEGAKIRDAAAIVASTADNDANRVRRGFEDGLIRRNGNVIRRVVLGDAEINLVDPLLFRRVERGRIAVEIERRVKFAAPTGSVNTVEVEINDVRRFRDAAGNREPIEFDGRIVDVNGAELLVRVDRDSRLVVRGIPRVHRVENEASRRVRLTDETCGVREPQRVLQIDDRS